MSRLRRQLAGLVPAVAALFALGVAVPRSGWLHHHHAGGERAHVHAADDELDGLLAEIVEHRHAHDQGAAHAHHHRHRAARPAPQRAAAAAPHGAQFRRAGGGESGHWHQRQHFQRAIVPAVPYVSAVAAAGRSPETIPPRVDRAAVHASHARAPPAPLFSDC